ncbi:hypothetical protein BIFGAL_03134 [Bifidobacterium gallicum DSM 20093 = LMG 11596]|uniref:Uncharacterized protein n=1 Tax=Bifidobacterium gallicum DSM 20093 = LMG 11596 TaxID=561180 RepID=D1NTH6_9BIFI|nr:hypothetical protein BIFGAL_03134 [Bifidobacterium gallicum DSM 20093 = LMG 11596]
MNNSKYRSAFIERTRLWLNAVSSRVMMISTFKRSAVARMRSSSKSGSLESAALMQSIEEQSVTVQIVTMDWIAMRIASRPNRLAPI